MSESDNKWLYWVIGGVVLVLCIIGLFTYSEKKETQQAQAKAQELTQKLEAAGLRTPEDPKVFVRTLGDDGGAVCDNPTESYGKALLFDAADQRRRLRRAPPGDRRPRHPPRRRR